MARKNVHVVPHPDGWAVRREGASKPSKVMPTQEKAAAVAHEQAVRIGGELLIHGVNGQIRERSSFGPDPCPPKDAK